MTYHEITNTESTLDRSVLVADIDVTEDVNGTHCVQIDGAMLTPHEAIQFAFDIVQHAATAAHANGRANPAT